jgi:phosphatidate cytidylyltransferase
MNISLAPGIPLVLAGNLTILMVATGFLGFFKDRLKLASYSELQKRIKSWWIIFALCSMVFMSNEGVFLMFLAMLSYIALKEFVSMVSTRRTDRNIYLLAYFTIPLQYLWIAQGWYGLFITFIPIIMFLLLQVIMMVNSNPKGYLSSFAILYFGLMTTVFSLSHLGYLMILPASDTIEISGTCLVLYLVVLTQLNDVSQYIWGKFLGTRKIMPSISPNKTWEGMLGGMMMTALLSLLLAPILTPFGSFLAICIGALIAITGLLGDLSISAIKRDLGLKDTGNLLPGHGGLLDRIDSLIFTAPLFFHGYYAYLLYNGQLP